MTDRVKFRAMKDGDRADHALLDRHERAFASGTADRLPDALAGLDASLSGYQVTRLGHSLQAATRAWHDGADDDGVVSALLHDLGDNYAPCNHDEYAAAILRPFVRAHCAWVVEKHGDFQRLYYAHHTGGNPDAHERYRGHPCFDDCAEFCENWDQSSFDPDYPSLPLDHFRPLVVAVFARTAHDPAVLLPGIRVPLTDAARATLRAAGGTAAEWQA
jgi:predicted HD phosphohydrolase